jgi:hypothetical protein
MQTRARDCAGERAEFQEILKWPRAIHAASPVCHEGRNPYPCLGRRRRAVACRLRWRPASSRRDMPGRRRRAPRRALVVIHPLLPHAARRAGRRVHRNGWRAPSHPRTETRNRAAGFARIIRKHSFTAATSRTGYQSRGRAALQWIIPPVGKLRQVQRGRLQPLRELQNPVRPDAFPGSPRLSNSACE